MIEKAFQNTRPQSRPPFSPDIQSKKMSPALVSTHTRNSLPNNNSLLLLLPALKRARPPLAHYQPRTSGVLVREAPVGLEAARLPRRPGEDARAAAPAAAAAAGAAAVRAAVLERVEEEVRERITADYARDDDRELGQA